MWGCRWFTWGRCMSCLLPWDSWLPVRRLTDPACQPADALTPSSALWRPSVPFGTTMRCLSSPWQTCLSRPWHSCLSCPWSTCLSCPEDYTGVHFVLLVYLPTMSFKTATRCLLCCWPSCLSCLRSSPFCAIWPTCLSCDLDHLPFVPLPTCSILAPAHLHGALPCCLQL